MPEIVEILRDFRNLQSLLAHHHVLRAAARAPNPPISLLRDKEKNWDAIGEVEEILAKRVERIKGYLKDSQIEVWKKVNRKGEEGAGGERGGEGGRVGSGVQQHAARTQPSHLTLAKERGELECQWNWRSRRDNVWNALTILAR